MDRSEVACSGESVTFIDMSKTRIEPRSMVTSALPLEPAEMEAMIRMKKRSIGAAEDEEQGGQVGEEGDEELFHGGKGDGGDSTS